MITQLVSKTRLLFVAALFLARTLMAQSASESPVSWTFEAHPKGNQEYELRYKATITEGWYLYSTKMFGEEGPVPTTFEYDSSSHFSLVGKVTESGDLKENFDPNFGMKLLKFSHTATFSQVVKVTNASQPVKGYLTFMTCNDKSCLPPKDVDFNFNLDPTGANTPLSTAATEGIFDSKRDIKSDQFLATCSSDSVEQTDSVLWIFIFGFLGGLLALLTPCVFPMIPLTVSFFTKNSGTRAKGIRNATIYGLSIIGIYVGIGIVLTSLFGPTILNEMSTDMYFNLLFFVVFIAFAGSFFGYYELTLPSSWSTKTDQMADEKGGLIGIFFMAFTLALVSFSCTGPIIGTLLVQTVQNAQDSVLGLIPLKPLVGMVAFSLALALPFSLFAAFPSWLKTLPRSGAWMTKVKVTLGFVELALAFKFLSTADMVRHWNFLKLELFLALWIVIFAGLALYHFGFIRFPHDSKNAKITRGSQIVGALSVLFVGYLATGFTYKPLSLLSGLAPPVHYSFWGQAECPHGLNCFHEFDEAVAYAQKVNKPLFVDFTGYGCVNCRKMEENIWVKPEIINALRNDYVVVSLYVDDKQRLFPDDKQKFLVDKHTQEKLRTVGAKWSSFQVNNFGISSQPYYVLMSNDGKTLLNRPVAYMPDVATYKAFLDCGKQAFEMNSQSSKTNTLGKLR